MSDDWEPIDDDIGLGESPRWHGGRIWYCDWLDGEIRSVRPDGSDTRTHARFEGFPISIDWDPSGRLLVVEGANRRLCREHDGGFETVADLSAVSPSPWNEIAAHPAGWTFVNGIGFDMMAGEAPRLGQIAMVAPDGTVRKVADDLAFPNGMVIVCDGSRLVVAESHAGRITSFRIQPDGDLTERKTVAEIAGAAPDGLCQAENHSIWYADVPNRHCRRVSLEGSVLETVAADRGCFSCTVAPDGDLFATAAVWDDQTFSTRRGVLYRRAARSATSRSRAGG